MIPRVIACEVMKEELLSIKCDGSVDFDFVPQGLHAHPEKLNTELQKMLDSTEGYDRVILAFGLCGGGARNLRAGNFILTIPRVHDCIALLLGSRQTYDRVRKEEPGTLYLSAGWVRGEAPIVSEMDRTIQRYGRDRATKLLKRLYDAYKRVLFISTATPKEEKYLERSRQAAVVLDLDHQEISGDPGYLRLLINGPWDQGGFINVPPFGTVEEIAFLESSADNYAV
jgi:hypothetical protein